MSAPKTPRDKPASRDAQLWQSWVELLGPLARRRALARAKEPGLPRQSPEIRNDEAEEYKSWRCTLSERTQETIDKLVVMSEAAEDTNSVSNRFCVLEAPDGEYPVLHVFRDVEALARRLGQLEGQDVSAWAFYGIPLPFTKGPQRYLMMPDQETMVTIPMVPHGPVKRADMELLDVEVQDDGFLGPPELVTTPSLLKAEKAIAGVAAPSKPSIPPQTPKRRPERGSGPKKNDNDDEDDEETDDDRSDGSPVKR